MDAECILAVLGVALFVAIIVGTMKIVRRIESLEQGIDGLRDAIRQMARRDLARHEREEADALEAGPAARVAAAATHVAKVAAQPAAKPVQAPVTAAPPSPAAPTLPPAAPAPTPVPAHAPAVAEVPPAAPVTVPAAAGSVAGPDSDLPKRWPPPPRAAPPRSEPVPAETPFSLESFLGGRVLLVAGVVAVLFGLGFFLKLAIEKEWIGPVGRLVTGLAAGVAALVAGDRLRARGLSVFGQALMGCGLGALFLTDHFAAVRYGFLTQPQAFALAAGVAALAAYLAISRDAPFLAWLGFLGAYLSPALLGRNQDALEGLALWLAVVGLGLTVVLAKRPWRFLDLLPFTASWAYVLLWRGEWYQPLRADAAGTCIAALTAVLLVVAYVPAFWSRRRIPATSHAAAALALVVATATAHDILFPERRYHIGAGLALAGFVLVGGSSVARRRCAEGVQDSSVLFTMALAALAAAVPFLLGGNAVVVAWSAFGAALVHAAARKGSVATAAVGLTTIGCSLVAALNERAALHGDFTPFLNAEFLSAVAPAAALALAWRSIERGAEQLRTASVPLLIASTFVGSALLVAEAVRARGLDNASAAFRETALACCAVVAAVFAATVALLSRRRELEVRAAAWAPLAASMLFGIWMLAYGHLEEFTPAVNAPFGAGLVVAAALFLAGALGTLGPVPGVAAVGYLFFLITAEIWAWGRFPHAGLAHDEVRFRVQVGLSVAWTVYAAALVAVGFWRDRALLRWSGIALFLVTAAKVFLVDLDRLETAYRVGSFLVLGILLVAVSYLYQRARRTTGPTTPAVPPATPDPPEPPAA